MTTDNIPVAEFVEESVELLQQMEEAALELDARPGDRALVDQLFRGMHTIKGGAAVVKRPDLADYAHRLEHLLDQVRGGHVSADKTVISTLLDAIDCVGLFVTGIQTGLPVDQARVDTSVQNVSALVGSANQLAHEVQATGEATPSELMSIDSNNSQAYLVTLKFHPQMPERGGDPLLLLKELAELGDCVIVAHPGNLPNIEEFDATRLYLWWSIKLTTSLSQSEIEQTLLFFKEGNELSVVPFDATPEETDTVEQAHKAQIAQAVAGAEDDVQSTPLLSNKAWRNLCIKCRHLGSFPDGSPPIGCSIFCAIQNYTAQGGDGIPKAIRGNVNCVAIWRTGNMKELDLLMTELSGQIPKEKLLKAYHAVMDKDPDDRHACLFVDLNPKPHHPSPFRINYTDWLILDD